jgi:hypothetical protein
MKPPNEDATLELSESLRRLADSDVLWARLIGKSLRRLYIPTRRDQSDEPHQA